MVARTQAAVNEGGVADDHRDVPRGEDLCVGPTGQEGGEARSHLGGRALEGGGADRNEARDPSRSMADPSTVTAEDIDRTPAEPIEDLLQGRIAGVQVTRAPGGIRIRIRGATSIHGSTEPLYVLDGVPIRPGSGGTLPLNPNDIESIRVLKDPVDTTMYGSRGANGVIVIKTKRPRS